MDIFQQLTNLVGQGAAPRQAQQGGAGGLEGLLNPSMLSGLIGSLLGETSLQGRLIMGEP